ncbi:unnamed protein product [Pipistrellus nathusii]|uniref:Uncharacterized protein n=1 Tax=Pipistrellus nathusii TaxID=59473 RepID=A0ABP0ADG5_PIPNA
MSNVYYKILIFVAFLLFLQNILNIQFSLWLGLAFFFFPPFFFFLKFKYFLKGTFFTISESRIIIACWHLDSSETTICYLFFNVDCIGYLLLHNKTLQNVVVFNNSDMTGQFFAGLGLYMVFHPLAASL